VVDLQETSVRARGSIRIERNPRTGEYTKTVGVGTEHEQVTESFNMYSSFEDYLNNTTYAHLSTGLDQITITDRGGNMMAIFMFEDGIWTLVQ